jgi:activator of HSP90 ATPase
MANALYPLWKQEIMKGTSNNLLNSSEGATGVYAALVDTGTYTYSAAHQFYSSLTGVVGTDQEILTKTQAAGVFDGTDITFPLVTGATVEALVLYRKNAGANTTWPLIAYIDTGVTGLPVTPNGGNIGVTWNASGIFAL